MECGKLRHKLVFYDVSESRDGQGRVTVSNAVIGTRRAQVRYLRGNELFAAQQIHPEATVEFRFRFFEGLTEKHRVELGGTPHNILFINDVDYRHHEHRVICSKGLIA